MGLREVGSLGMRTVFSHRHDGPKEAVASELVDAIPVVGGFTAGARTLHAAVTIDGSQSRVRNIVGFGVKAVIAGAAGPLSLLWPANLVKYGADRGARITRPIVVAGNVVTLPVHFLGRCPGDGKVMQCFREVPEYVRD